MLVAIIALVSTWALVSASTGQLVTVTVNPTGTYDHLGVATVSGTLDCAGPGTFQFFNLSVQQPIGRKSSVSGNVSLNNLGCGSGSPVAWSAQVVPTAGKFGGNAAIVTGSYYGYVLITVISPNSYPTPPYPNCYYYSVDYSTGTFVFQCSVNGTFGPQTVSLTNAK